MKKNESKAPILIVEDEADLRDILRDECLRQNRAILCCKSGNEALEALKHNPGIRTIVSDLRMSDGNGLELAKAVQGLKLSPPIFFVLISGYSDVSSSQAKAFGISKILLKPFKLKDLEFIFEGP